LFQGHHALLVFFVPLVLAGRGDAEHPVTQVAGRHGRPQAVLQLLPRGVGLELQAIAGLQREIGVAARAAQFQANAADAYGTANVHIRDVTALPPFEAARAAILRAGDTETTT